MAWCLVKHRDKLNFYLIYSKNSITTTPTWQVSTAAMLVLYTEGNYKIQQWGGLKCHEFHTKSHEYPSFVCVGRGRTLILYHIFIFPQNEGLQLLIFSQGKAPGAWTDQSPPSSAEVKNARSYTSTPPWRGAWLTNEYVFMAWYLVKLWDSFTFTVP
jgi:hypothetical protein